MSKTTDQLKRRIKAAEDDFAPQKAVISNVRFVEPTKKPGRGGSRPGAGRKPGTQDKSESKSKILGYRVPITIAAEADNAIRDMLADRFKISFTRYTKKLA